MENVSNADDSLLSTFTEKNMIMILELRKYIHIQK